MDAIDAKLLAEVQRNARQTSDQLARAVGLSATACQRRLKRLRELGVIQAEVAVLSPKAVGRSLLMIVSVSLERERSEIIDRFKQSIRQAPEVMQAYYVTGEADFILVITARHMDEYEAFSRRFFYENPDIRGFKTSVVMDRVKAGLAIPIILQESGAAIPPRLKKPVVAAGRTPITSLPLNPRDADPARRKGGA